MTFRRTHAIVGALCGLLLTVVGVISAHDHDHPVFTPSGETSIRFAARVGDLDVACGFMYDGLGSQESSVELTDFRLYVSNVRLINHDGEDVPVELVQDGLWQHENVALLDFEDGSYGCADSGNDLVHTKIVANVPEGEYTGLVFELGVPVELNHLDTTVAPSPLNIAAMWWGWQFGYKFLKIDMMADGKPWFVHLGSTGCESANETTPPEQPCSTPNRIEVRMEGFNPAHNFVVADLSTLVQDIDLSTSVPEPPGCMSFPGDPDCTTLFGNLGLSLETGLQLADVTQKMFRMQ